MPVETSRSTTPVRADIQALRAIAVSAVLLYHLWPRWLPGGFVGVDVFFVISGFLITSHLLAHPPRNPRDLVQFWSRRIRRLLPAALLVLAVTLVASRLIAPETQWENTAQQVKAAALYVVNWRLASDSVDYLAAGNAASPVQHFWSLSVEEQFYLGWPVLILALCAFSRSPGGRHARRRDVQGPVVVAGILLVTAVSFAYSVHLTGVDPARAFFVTPTRIWELGLGGLAAAFVSRRALGRGHGTEVPAEGRAVPQSSAPRAALAWTGLGLIALAIGLYDESTPFPGWHAAVPTVGAVLVIAANAPAQRLSPVPVMALRPVQWLGDVSYSVYLWHWPMIILLPGATGHRLGVRDKVAILVVSLLLAALTKRLVEDPFRTPRWGRPLVKPFAVAALGMALVVGASLAQSTEVHNRETAAAQRRDEALSSADACFGAPALGNSACPQRTSGPLTPAPIAASRDMSHAYADVSSGVECSSDLPSYPDVRCQFGAPSGSLRVALVGNSHAAQWVDAIDRIAKERGWRVTTYLASRCVSSAVSQDYSLVTTNADASRACRSWVDRTTSAVARAKYDLVIMSNRISQTAVGHDLATSLSYYGAGFTSVLRKIRPSGAAIVSIRDTPVPGKPIPDCLAEHPDEYDRCDGTRADWLPPDPSVQALAGLHAPDATVADLTSRICLPTVCPAQVGGVPVYFDGSHLTATYSLTLARYLAPFLVRAVT